MLIKYLNRSSISIGKIIGLNNQSFLFVSKKLETFLNLKRSVISIETGRYKQTTSINESMNNVVYVLPPFTPNPLDSEDLKSTYLDESVLLIKTQFGSCSGAEHIKEKTHG